ncbi:hypothetical protein [Streptomyces vilmorinianum]|uniref:hypothetical protein n=1 Tax=Streptomyces vilmorinianum TaxID=3051092 RepID=UPI0015861858|nr:hypothetical protein [Streptomyces vilmorinianum]
MTRRRALVAGGGVVVAAGIGAGVVTTASAGQGKVTASGAGSASGEACYVLTSETTEADQPTTAARPSSSSEGPLRGYTGAAGGFPGT